MKSVLYLSYDGLTDPLGQSQIIPYLEGLALEGFQISIISFEKNNPSKLRKEIIADKLQKVAINWHPLIYHKSPPVLSTLWDMLRLWQLIQRLHNKHRFNVVHCRSYITAIVGLAMKRKYNTRFLFDMRGFWVDERVDGGLWNLKNPLYKRIYNYFKKQEKAFLENADAIVSLTYSAKEEIMGWRNVNISAPIHVIPCCVDLALFNEDSVKDVEQTKKRLGLVSTDFVLTYLGAIGTWYMLDEMIDFFKVLLEKKANAKFLFISPEKHSIIKKVAKHKGIPENKILVYKAKREEVPNLLKLSDLSIFFIKPVFSKKASSPTKQGELMSMGIPIICNDGVGDTTRIIQQYQAGTVVENFNESDYSQVIQNLNLLLNKDKSQIREGALNYFSLEKGIESYSNIYRKISS